MHVCRAFSLNVHVYLIEALKPLSCRIGIPLSNEVRNLKEKKKAEKNVYRNSTCDMLQHHSAYHNRTDMCMPPG